MIHYPYADIGGNKMNLIPPSDGKLQSVEEKETKCVNARTPLLWASSYLFISNNSIILL